MAYFARFLKHSVLYITAFYAFGAKAQLTDSQRIAGQKQGFTNLLVNNKIGPDSLVDIMDVLQYVFAHKSYLRDSIPKKTNGAAISFVPGILYTLSTGLAASINANATLHSGSEKENLSNIFFNINYTQKKQAIAQLVTNIWTKDNKYNFNTNWEYLKYPQQDFGLGGYSSSDLLDNFDYSYVRLYQSLLKRISQNLYIGPGINLDYHWNIIDTTAMNKPVYGAAQYGLTTQSATVGFLLSVLYDTRKNLANPLPGSSLINVVYRNNVTWLGSNHPSQTLLIDLRKFIRFPANSNNILAFWNYNLLTLQGHLPYLDLPSTGWDTYNNTGRGYIQGRFRGTDMVYAESEYRYHITRNDLFGGVIFVNAEGFPEPKNSKVVTISPGYGAGIRVKFNKHSNTNICIDYAFGKGGSHGLFMNLGEAF